MAQVICGSSQVQGRLLLSDDGRHAATGLEEQREGERTAELLGLPIYMLSAGEAAAPWGAQAQQNGGRATSVGCMAELSADDTSAAGQAQEVWWLRV